MFILNRWFVLIKKIRKPLNVTLTFLTKDLIDFPQIWLKKKKKKRMASKISITFILESLVVPPIWVALIGVIYSRIAPFFALNRISFPANDKALIKHNNQ